jgi:hypothetical protein
LFLLWLGIFSLVVFIVKYRKASQLAVSFDYLFEGFLLCGLKHISRFSPSIVNAQGATDHISQFFSRLLILHYSRTFTFSALEVVPRKSNSRAPCSCDANTVA